MRAPTTTGWRILRSTIFAGVAGYLAFLGHVVGGGGAPSVGPTIGLTAIIGFIVSGFATKERTFVSLFPLMALIQVAFHFSFLTATHAHHDVAFNNGRMVLFHLIAGAITALILAKGERALFGLIAALRRVFCWLPAQVAVPLTPVLTPVWSYRACFLTTDLRGGACRRGPPIIGY